MPSIPFFDTKECEWADSTVIMAGSPVTKIRGFNVTPKQSKEHLHAAGDEPISIQRGNRTYEGSLKLLKGALDDINTAAIAAGGSDALDISVDLVVMYRARGARALQRMTVIGVEFTELPRGWDQGAKMMEITLPFLALKVVEA